MLSSIAAAVTLAKANVSVLTFEGVGNNIAVDNFYNGGTGPNYGIQFSSNALGLVDIDAGGSGNFGGEPSPDTGLYFLQAGAATMNVAGGFDTGFSFFYSAVVFPGTVFVYEGLNATGAILASIELPMTPYFAAPDPGGEYSPFVAIGVTFAGTAMSVDFGGTANYIVFDDITLGSERPGPPQGVPDSGVTAWMILGGLAGLVGIARHRK